MALPAVRAGGSLPCCVGSVLELRELLHSVAAGSPGTRSGESETAEEALECLNSPCLGRVAWCRRSRA